jgi:hypothetical protein
MRLDAWRGWWAERGRFERVVVFLWILAAVICCGRSMAWPARHSVYPIYSLAGRAWRAGIDLYRTQTGEPFRYSPLVAASFAPLSLLPDHVGGVLWRLLGLGAYLGALAWWARRVADGPLASSRYAWLFLLILPLSIGSLNNGQSNLLLIGLLLAACAGAMAKRWNLSTICVAIAVLFKAYPLAIGLLLLLVYPRRYWWRLPAAITVALLLPFLLQNPSYVAEQYTGWLAHLQNNDRQAGDPTQWYRDFRQLWSLWIGPMHYHVYQIIEILAGAAVAALCCMRWRTGGADGRSHVFLFSLGCCWMTVFGPATESATYVFLAPAAAWAVLRTGRERYPPLGRYLILTGYGLLVLAQVANWFPVGRMVHSFGLQPIAGLLLTAGFVAVGWTVSAAPPNRVVTTAIPVQAA